MHVACLLRSVRHPTRLGPLRLTLHLQLVAAEARPAVEGCGGSPLGFVTDRLTIAVVSWEARPIATGCGDSPQRDNVSPILVS